MPGGLLQSASLWQGMQQLSAATWLLQRSSPVPQSLASCTHALTHSLCGSQCSERTFHQSGRCLSSSAQSSPQSSSNATSKPASSKHNSKQSSQASRGPSIKQLRAEIFEQHIGDGRRSGRKAILKPLKGRIIADWYFTLTGPKMHLFDEPIEEE